MPKLYDNSQELLRKMNECNHLFYGLRCLVAGFPFVINQKKQMFQLFFNFHYTPKQQIVFKTTTMKGNELCDEMQHVLSKKWINKTTKLLYTKISILYDTRFICSRTNAFGFRSKEQIVFCYISAKPGHQNVFSRQLVVTIKSVY